MGNDIPLSRKIIIYFILLVPALLIIGLIIFSKYIIEGNKKKYNLETQKKEKFYIWSSVFSISFPIIYYYFSIIYFSIYKETFIRNHKIIVFLSLIPSITIVTMYTIYALNNPRILKRKDVLSMKWVIGDDGIKPITPRKSGTETYIANIELQKKDNCADTYNSSTEIDGHLIETGYDVNGTYCVDYVNKKLDKSDEDGNEYDRYNNVVDRIGLIYDRENINIINPLYNPVTTQEKCQGPNYPCIFTHETNSEGSKLVTDYKNLDGKKLTDILISDIWDEKIDINDKDLVNKLNYIYFDSETLTVKYKSHENTEKISTPVLVNDIPPVEDYYNHGLQILLILSCMKRYGVNRPISVDLNFASVYK